MNTLLNNTDTVLGFVIFTGVVIAMAMLFSVLFDKDDEPPYFT